jgi:protein-S-isoprenylcysteine O-methyltransferase Ste14
MRWGSLYDGHRGMMDDLQYAWRGWILGAIFLALALSRWHSHAPLLPAGLGLVALGAGYRFYAGRYIPGHSNGLGLAGDALAVGGPYRFGRHPLYLSNLAVILGLIGFANSLPVWGSAALFMLAAAHHTLLARAEERFLSRTRGEAYRGYLETTPRWFGAPRSGASAASAPPGAATAGSRPEAAPTSGDGNTGDTRAAWKRQGANIGKAAACAVILWALAALGR